MNAGIYFAWNLMPSPIKTLLIALIIAHAVISEHAHAAGLITKSCQAVYSVTRRFLVRNMTPDELAAEQKRHFSLLRDTMSDYLKDKVSEDAVINAASAYLDHHLEIKYKFHTMRREESQAIVFLPTDSSELNLKAQMLQHRLDKKLLLAFIPSDLKKGIEASFDSVIDSFVGLSSIELLSLRTHGTFEHEFEHARLDHELRAGRDSLFHGEVHNLKTRFDKVSYANYLSFNELSTMPKGLASIAREILSDLDDYSRLETIMTFLLQGHVTAARQAADAFLSFYNSHKVMALVPSPSSPARAIYGDKYFPINDYVGIKWIIGMKGAPAEYAVFTPLVGRLKALNAKELRDTIDTRLNTLAEIANDFISELPLPDELERLTSDPKSQKEAIKQLMETLIKLDTKIEKLRKEPN